MISRTLFIVPDFPTIDWKWNYMEPIKIFTSEIAALKYLQSLPLEVQVLFINAAKREFGLGDLSSWIFKEEGL